MKKKQGISLIVLVITIIVMIILAASVVITLSDTGIIDKANQAVQLTDEKQVQDLASLVWAEAYMDGLRGEQLNEVVISKLETEKITENWIIRVSDSGVMVKPKSIAKELGSLLTPDNYGNTVDYEVTVNDKVYDKWQIYYHNSEFVFLIAAEAVENKPLDKGTAVNSLTDEELNLYNKFMVGETEKYTLVDGDGGTTLYSCQGVAQLIKDYASFANMLDYGDDVIGAIGGPTIQLLTCGWNAKKYTPELKIDTSRQGYTINDSYVRLDECDGFYVHETDIYWLASPSNSDVTGVMTAGNYLIQGSNCRLAYHTYGIRPVVCLKASIPAVVGTTTDFSLVK